MEMHNQTIETKPLPAASLVMLRDGEGSGGLEVFLLKRHALSDVLGGAFVFPGGKVDPGDALLDIAAHLDRPGAELHCTLGEAALDVATAAGLYVAALREAFEETGVLYAQGVDAAGAARAAGLLRQGRSFGEMLAATGLRLSAAAIHPWSRWITPRAGGVVRKRFDTRFFVAAMPAGQQAVHDDHEAVDSVWLAPRVALQSFLDGHIELAPPQIMSLAHLARHASVQSVLDAGQACSPPLIQPEPFSHDGERGLCYPGDAQHSLQERALPGPTRLYFRNQRFEPDGGLPALLA